MTSSSKPDPSQFPSSFKKKKKKHITSSMLCVRDQQRSEYFESLPFVYYLAFFPLSSSLLWNMKSTTKVPIPSLITCTHCIVTPFHVHVKFFCRKNIWKEIQLKFIVQIQSSKTSEKSMNWTRDFGKSSLEATKQLCSLAWCLKAVRASHVKRGQLVATTVKSCRIWTSRISAIRWGWRIHDWGSRRVL